MDWLKKILKVANEAKEVIEDIADSVKDDGGHPGSVQETSSAGDAASADVSAGGSGSGGNVDDGFQRQVDAGAADPRKLLTREEAAQLLGGAVKPVSASDLEDYINIGRSCRS